MKEPLRCQNRHCSNTVGYVVHFVCSQEPDDVILYRSTVEDEKTDKLFCSVKCQEQEEEERKEQEDGEE